MVDDVGTKVSAAGFTNSPPSWAIETSPGNFQYGFIFSEPITDREIVDELKERLIAAGLCDSGATGGTARWMRLPVAINGRPKYGVPSPKCNLTQWRPDLKYSLEELYSKLNLIKTQPIAVIKSTFYKTNSIPTVPLLSEDGNHVMDALILKGLYKKPLGSGKHDITCPWVIQHTDAIDNGTVYFEPSLQYPTGGFICHHSHKSLFHINELKEYLGVTTSPSNSTTSETPQKLPPALRPVPALDTNQLPDSIRDAVIDLADRLQCPMDYLAVAILSAAGAVIGNKVGVFLTPTMKAGKFIQLFGVVL
jgi:hypothetical protein